MRIDFLEWDVMQGDKLIAAFVLKDDAERFVSQLAELAPRLVLSVDRRGPSTQSDGHQ